LVLESSKPYCCLCTVRGGGHVIPQQAYRFLFHYSPRFSAALAETDIFDT
jgi:hypothetical protein